MGIIETFKMITLYGSGDTKSLSGGISEALITTKVGLLHSLEALNWHDDVKADDVELAIRTAFDGVPKSSSENPVPPCLKAQSRHFPPIVHEWSHHKPHHSS